MATSSAVLDRAVRSRHEPTGVAAHDLRQRMRGMLAVWPLGPDRVADALLVLEELVANVVDHARTEFSVSVTCSGPQLRLAVRDGSDHGPLLRPHDVTAIRGRGLQLVDTLAEQWGCDWHHQGKTVWALLAV